MWAWSLGQEDPLKEDMATHSSILAWRIPVDRGAWRAAVHGVAVRHDWVTKHNTYTHTAIFSFDPTFAVVLFLFSLSGRPTTLVETMGKAEMWLIRNYWDFSFPRPRLPNFEFVGGIHCKPAKSLPKVTYSSLLFFVNFVFSIRIILHSLFRMFDCNESDMGSWIQWTSS